MAVNRQWLVARYPEPGEVIGAEHFDLASTAVPEPAEGEFLVRTVCLATGPAQRGYLDNRVGGFYGEPLPLGAVMRGRGIGEIVSSRHPDYHPGQIFVGSLGWQDYSVQAPKGKEFVFSTRIIDEPVRPLSLHLGILGQAGGTAYFGITEAGEVGPGDNVLISAAAGGIGSVAGQLANIMGAQSVIGIAGSDDKCRWLCDELGFTAAINYKREDLHKRLTELFPDGIDVFFDNVGGATLNTALLHLAMHARVAISGFIATQYGDNTDTGPTNYPQLVFRRARMQGFVYFDYWDRYAEAERKLKDWYDAGELVSTESVDDGLENMPAALATLFTGTNRGIKLCRVADDPST